MSAQALSILEAGKADTYYADDRSGLVQAIPVELNYRYRQDFQNLTAGVNTLIIPPGNGLRCPVIVLEYSQAAIQTSSGVNNTGAYALAKGWGYQALKQVSWRVGGSSQFFLSGAQLLAKNLRMCRTQSQRQAILDLGGAQCLVQADFQKNQRAYIPLPFWCPPASDGITLPLPGDLLSQQTVITAELNPPSAYWVANRNPSGAQTGFVPSGLSTAYFRVEQLVMNDKSMSLGAMYDMSEKSYSMPVVFDQQEQVITGLTPTTDPQSVVLTGFRAGEVREIQIWLEDTTPAAVASASTGVVQRFYAPDAIQCLYAGTIFADFQKGESRIWNLIDGTAPNVVDTLDLVQPGAVAGAITQVAAKSEWVSLPFAQRTGDDYEAEVLTHGKEITNGIVNLTVSLPDAGVVSGASKYRLHAVYVYNSALNFSRGTADYFF
jgi:hypothetical protein